MPITVYIVVVFAAYLIGSVPSGFLVGKARGIDIRTVGSGNIGATNVFRALGTPAGIFVLLADALKGWISVSLVAAAMAGWLAPGTRGQPVENLQIVAGIGAVLGHNYTVWLRFRGGKGIATSAGVLLALVPGALGIVLVVWILVFALSRYVSLASLCASAALPLATWLTHQSRALLIVTAALAVLAIYKHRSNIQRLLKGTENRFGKKSPPATVPPGSQR